MEISGIVIILQFIVIALLNVFLYRFMNKTDQAIAISEKLVEQFKQSQKTAIEGRNLTIESQDNFINFSKLVLEEYSDFYKQNGYWANEATLLGLCYHCTKLEDKSTEIVLGLKGWDLQKCYEQGNIFIANSQNPKEIIRTLSKMFVSDAMKSYKSSLEKINVGN